MAIKTLYTATSTATGARTGHIRSSDGNLSVDLSSPKEMGGPGGNGTNPEQLFAGGYAACFAGAMEFIARQKKIQTGTIKVTAHVGIGPAETTPGFGLSVALEVTVPELDQAATESLVEEAHTVCPYSNATRGNIEVQLKAIGGK